MSQTTFHPETELQSAASLIPPQRTVERPPSTRTLAQPRQPEPPAAPERRSALQRLGALLLRPAPSAEQVERAAAAASWARQHPIEGHSDPLMVHQPFLRGLR